MVGGIVEAQVNSVFFSVCRREREREKGDTGRREKRHRERGKDGRHKKTRTGGLA